MAHIEANSLSDITHLAGNPPKYPRNPTETKRQALTLYIARVPGTRDIILTTLKPQLKNVTASDVANSLYYFHLNSDEDARIIEEEQKNSKSDADTPVLAQKPVARKALPDSARSSIDLSRQSVTPLVRLNSNSSVTKRKPVPSTDGVLKLSDPVARKPPLARRPLGPRPQNVDSTIERKPFTSDQQHDSNQTIRSNNTSPVQLDSAVGISNRYLQPSLPHSQPHATKEPPAFTITVIRRDLSSASQWNVGTVIGTPVHPDEFGQNSSPQRNKKPHYDLSVQLTNPGYTPFKHSYLSSQMEAMNLSPISPIKSAGGNNGQSKSGFKSDHGFEREVKMEGADFWTRSKPQHLRSKSDMTLTQGVTRGRSFSGSEVINPPEAQHRADPSTASKGYVFLSPWNGRCKFSTSSSGRSLRCRHTLPEPVSASQGDDDDQPAKTSVMVSEIRFNLPSAAIFNSVSETFSRKGEGNNQRFSVPVFDHIRSKFSAQKSSPAYLQRPSNNAYSSHSREDEATPPLPPRPTHNQTDSSDDEHSYRHNVGQHRLSTDQRNNDEDNSHLDLTLGQEKAGGGNRGKRAKLGKLIIHDEGFKFLDLLVAANMGVWWSVWEPDF